MNSVIQYELMPVWHFLKACIISPLSPICTYRSRALYPPTKLSNWHVCVMCSLWICFKCFGFSFSACRKLKKLLEKVAYLWQLGVFFLCCPDCPKQPRISFPFYKFFCTTISCRISDCNPQHSSLENRAWAIIAIQLFI